jgi:hypothetical protein
MERRNPHQPHAFFREPQARRKPHGVRGLSIIRISTSRRPHLQNQKLRQSSTQQTRDMDPTHINKRNKKSGFGMLTARDHIKWSRLSRQLVPSRIHSNLEQARAEATPTGHRKDKRGKASALRITDDKSGALLTTFLWADRLHSARSTSCKFVLTAKVFVSTAKNDNIKINLAGERGEHQRNCPGTLTSGQGAYAHVRVWSHQRITIREQALGRSWSPVESRHSSQDGRGAGRDSSFQGLRIAIIKEEYLAKLQCRKREAKFVQ